MTIFSPALNRETRALKESKLRMDCFRSTGRPPKKKEVVSNQGVFEEFLLGHKVEEWFEGKTDDRDIGPVLMFRENNHRSTIRKRCFLLRLDPIKNGEDQLGQPFGCRIDEGIPSHHHKPMSNFKIPAFAEAPVLRKASGGGASRRQANFKSMSKAKCKKSF